MTNSIQKNLSEIGNYLGARMGENLDSADSKKHRVVNIAFRAIAVGASFLATPYLTPPSEMNKFESAWSVFVTGSELIGFSLFTAWASTKIIEEMIEPLGKREWKIIEIQKRILPRVAILVMSVSLGVFAKMGGAYLHYKASDNLYNPLTDLLIDSSIPSYSAMIALHFLLNSAWSATRFGTERKILRARNRLIRVLEEDIANIPRLTKDSRSDYAQRVIAAQTGDLREGVELATARQPDWDLAYPRKQWANLPGYLIGSVTGLSTILGLGYVGYVGFEKAGADKTLAVGLGVVTSLIFAQIIGSLVPKQTARVLRTVTYCTFERDLSDAVAPKMSLIFKSTLLATTALVWVSAVDAANPYLTGWLRIAAKVVWATATVALISSPLIEFQNEVTERVVAKSLGTEEDKAVVTYVLKMRTLIQVLKTAPLHKVAAFLGDLSDETWDCALGPRVGRDVFDSYIAKYAERTALLGRGSIV